MRLLLPVQSLSLPCCFSLLALSFWHFPDFATAQTIISTPDGTGTIVNITGDKYNISGGSRSQDGANLFHSFQRFDLNANQTATFLTAPTIQNILSRVNSSNPSIIQGLIQVTGSNANLYLINPAGILFSNTARLDVPGSFTATTATSLGFGSDRFNAIGSNPYAALVGAPTQFRFDLAQPGSIINQGSLSVSPGNSLTLLGGTVLNTGTLTAPDGTITIAAIPGSNQVRISQVGSLLSLEVTPTSLQIPFTPLSLPQLLTYAGLNHASQVIVNPDRSLQLQGSTVPLQPGTALASGSFTGRAINIFGDRVAVLNAAVNAPDGTVRIGGGYQGRDPVLNASRTIVDRTSTIDVNRGRAILWSNQVTGFFGTISARSGFVEVSGKESLIFRGNVDVGRSGTLLLDPRNILISNDPGDPSAEASLPNIFINSFAGTDITLNAGILASQTGSIILEATDHITIAPGISLNFARSAESIILLADADQDGIGAFSMDPSQTISTDGRPLIIDAASINLGNINTSTNAGPGGEVQLSAAGDIRAGAILTNGTTEAGNVFITSQTGNITTGNITAIADNGTPAAVSLDAPGTVTTGTPLAEPQELDKIVDEVTNYTASPEESAADGAATLDADSKLADPADNEFDGEDLVGIQLPVGDGFLDNRQAKRSLNQSEKGRLNEFRSYFGAGLAGKPMTPSEIRSVLSDIQQQTANRTAVIYVNAPRRETAITPVAELINTSAISIPRQNPKEQPLELLVFTGDRDPLRIAVPNVTRDQLMQIVQQFRSDLITSLRRRSTSYLKPAQQLHQWLIAPIEAKLGAGFTDTLLFSMDSGLRSLPIAALHDGKQYLIEKYSLGMTPAIGLMDPRYRSLQSAQVLAMGASQFRDLNPLPAVPTETSRIAQLWNGKTFLNQNFTRKNLVQVRQQTPFQIIHLATHAEFNPGQVSDSYIQLWDDKLRLDELPKLGWNQPAVDLLVLSACRTAVGNPEAELGFAGIAVASQVKTALASLWSVSDEGTLALMTSFYDELRSAKVKTEALRQAQLSMLRGHTQIESGRILRSGSTISLPPALGNLSQPNLAHPYFWSGFTLIGSPW